MFIVKLEDQNRVAATLELWCCERTPHEFSSPRVDKRSVGAAVIQTSQVPCQRIAVGQPQDITELLDE